MGCGARPALWLGVRGWGLRGLSSGEALPPGRAQYSSLSLPPRARPRYVRAVTVLLSCLALLYGGLASAVLTRPAYRLSVPPGRPWLDACPAGHPLPAGLLGWVGRGRCAECSASYGGSGRVARPVMMAAGVVLACATGWRPELVVWLLLLPVGGLLATVDLSVWRLPDVVTLPTAGATAALLGVVWLVPGAGGSWPRALLGGAVLACGYFALHRINPDGMGFGDVKLAATLGMVLGWYGWDVVFAGTLASFAVGAATGVALVLLGRAGRRSALPFGPFMVAGTLAGVVIGAA